MQPTRRMMQGAPNIRPRTNRCFVAWAETRHLPAVLGPLTASCALLRALESICPTQSTMPPSSRRRRAPCPCTQSPNRCLPSCRGLLVVLTLSVRVFALRGGVDLVRFLDSEALQHDQARDQDGCLKLSAESFARARRAPAALPSTWESRGQQARKPRRHCKASQASARRPTGRRHRRRQALAQPASPTCRHPKKGVKSRAAGRRARCPATLRPPQASGRTDRSVGRS